MKKSPSIFLLTLLSGVLSLFTERASAEPRNTAPQNTAPRNTAPRNTAPQNTAPQSTAPRNTESRKTQNTAPRKTQKLCAAPWRRLDDNAHNFVRPYSLILTGGAVIPPLTMGPSGADYDLRRFSQIQMGGSYSPEPVSLAAPYVFYPASILFYAGAAIGGYCPGQTRGAAIIQATTETLLVVGLIKWTTGRTWPLGGRSPDDPEVLDHPEDGKSWAPFQSGLAAFPSGHTAFFFAVAGAFRTASADLGLFRYAGYPLAAAMGFAMWYGDHHWVSDILSGALLGEAIGAAAGRSWAAEGTTEETSFLILPTRSGFVGTVAGSF